jgi:hypothetical protein
MKQQNIVNLPPAFRPSPRSCRKSDAGCCQLERALRIQIFRRAIKLWLKSDERTEERA